MKYHRVNLNNLTSSDIFDKDDFINIIDMESLLDIYVDNHISSHEDSHLSIAKIHVLVKIKNKCSEKIPIHNVVVVSDNVSYGSGGSDEGSSRGSSSRGSSGIIKNLF